MRLYHFLPSKYALSDLRNRHFKIARVAELNDPFELVAVDSSDPTQRTILRGWKNTFQNKWGILCFCKTWRNPVIWSHYADKHKGMCLGFDVKDKFLLPIRYTASRLDIDIVHLHDRGALNVNLMNKLLRTKFIDWKYEKEVRVSVRLQDRDTITGKYFYNFSNDLQLAEVIAGPLCSVPKDEILDALSSPDASVRIIKARLAFKTFKLVKNQKDFV